MDENLMETQSGGEGSTTQAAPAVVQTPDDFAVDIKPPVDSSIPEQESQDPVLVTKPESIPTDVNTEVEVPIQPVPNVTVDFTGNEPFVNPDSLSFSSIELLSQEEPVDDTPVFEFPEDYQPVDLPPPPPDEDVEPFDATEFIDQDDDSEFIQSVMATAGIQQAEKPAVEYDESGSLKQPEPDVEPDVEFNLDDPYKSIYSQKDGLERYENNPYSVGTVKDYQPSIVASRNFIKGYSRFLNTGIEETEALINSAVGSEYSQIDRLSSLTDDLSYNQSTLQVINNAITTGDYSELNNYDVDLLNGNKYGDDPKQNQIKANQLKRELEDYNKRIESEINSIKNPTKPEEIKPLSIYEKYDKGIQSDVRKSKTWAINNGYDAKFFDWLNSDSGFRYLVRQSLEGKDDKYTPGGVLYYKLSQMKDRNGFAESYQDEFGRSSMVLAQRIYQQEVNNHFEESGQGDYLSYSGFSLESKQLVQEEQKKIIQARDNVTKTVLPKYQKNMSDWESKNDAILNQRVSKIVMDANEIYKSGVEYIANQDPIVSETMSEYRERISTITDPEERKLVLKEFENKLLEHPKINDLNKKRTAAVEAAKNAEISDYMERKSIFAESNYNEAKQEFHDQFKKATYEEYRKGVNGDVNMYAKIDEVTRSQQFKKADFWKKREIIQTEWKKESKQLGSYLLGPTEYFPVNDQERAKHFTEWTGRKPKSPELMAKHKLEYNNRVGRQAQERYYFYAVDELLNPSDNKATPYVYKSMAKDEIAKLDLLLSEYAELYDMSNPDSPDYNKNKAGHVEVVASRKDIEKYLQSKDAWEKVLNHPENDMAWWQDLGRGFGENVGIPVISSVLGMSKQMNLLDAANNYRAGHMSMADISLVHANSAINGLKQIKPPSTAHNVGSMLGQTVDMVADILLTSGVYRASSAAARSSIDNIVTASVKGLYGASDNAFTSYALDVMSNPKTLEKIQNVVGVVAGTFGQTVALAPDVLESTAKRMTPEMIASYGGVYDPLIANIESNSEESAEAFLKSFGVTWSNLVIERFGGKLGTSEAKQALLREVGSTKFLQQTVVGNWARKQGFKTMDDAVNYINKNNIQFSSLFDEAIVEELILSKNIEALITGDSEMFEYTSDEVVTTILGVGLFSGMMNGYTYANAKVFTRPTSTDIETQDQLGNKVVTTIGKDTWAQFNTLLGSKDLTLQKMATFLDSKTLPEDQENALLNVYAKVKGKDLRNDPLYQKSKKEFEENLGEPIDDSAIESGSVVVLDEKNTEDAPEQGVVKPIEQEQIIDNTAPDSENAATQMEQAQESVSEEVKSTEAEVPSSVDFFESIKAQETDQPAADIMSNDVKIDYEETILVDHGPTIKDSLTVETVTLPPVQSGRPPRVMEKVDGSWKMKDGDSYLDVSEKIQQQAQVQFDSDQAAETTKAREKESVVEDEFRARIVDLFEGAKIKGDSLKSGLPIPPAVWNGFVDVVKDFVLKGYDITKAVQAARKQHLNDKIKAGEISRADANAAGKQIVKMYSDYNKKAPKPTKQTQVKINKETGVTADRPFLRIREKTILEEKIKSFNKGSKSATAELQDIKKQISDYAKSTLPLSELNATEIKSLLNKVARAKKIESVNTAFSDIDNIADKYDERRRKDKADNLIKVLSNKKTFVKKVSGKWKGKISSRALSDLDEFIQNELPSDLKSLSEGELDFYSDVVDGILNEGKLDIKLRDQAARIQKRKEDAVIFKALNTSKAQKINGDDAIIKWLDDGGKAIIGDEFISSKSAYEDYKRTNPNAQESADGYILKTAREQIESSKRKFEKNRLKYITKGGAISNIDNLMLFLYKGSPALKKFVTENVTTPIKEAHQSKINETRKALDKVVDARARIFGSKIKARNFLNAYSGVDLIKQFDEKDPDIVTNDMIVAMYAIAQTENGVDKLSKTIDVDTLMEYVDKHPKLKEYADYFVDDFLPKMKEEFSPLYSRLYDLDIPEGKYFPTFADNDMTTGYDLDGVLSGREAFNMRSAMASSLKQRVNYTGPVTITKGATSIMNNYINTMYHAKNFMPVAERINQLMSKSNTPEIISKVGHSVYGNMIQQFDAIINDRRPSIPSEGANKVMNAAMAINTVTTLGNKLSSIPKQGIAFLNYAFAGVQDGIYPHDWMAGFIPKGSDEIKSVAKFMRSPFIADRWKGGIDVEMRRLTERAMKNPTASAFNKIMKAMMLPIRSGDMMAVIGGGYPYLIAQYRKARKEGMSEEEAYDHAYKKVQIETNLSQQSDAPYAITNSQKSYWFRILFPFRSGQVSYANKTMSGVRKLMDYDNLSTDEKWQAVHDTLYFPTASFIFAAVASGLVNELYHVYVDGEDDDKLQKLYYETLKDGIQSNIQGYGVGGGLLDWTANIATGDDWKNNVPSIKYLTEAPKAMADIISILATSKEWDDLTETEKNRIKQSVGVKNMEKTLKNLDEFVKGDQNLYDAIMNYDPDKDPTDGDRIYEMFYGASAEGGGQTSSTGEDIIGGSIVDEEVIGGDGVIE